MQQRYYDPGIGVFLSVDPVTAYDNPMEQFHRYRYANNNPFRFIDPDGRSSQDRWYGHNERDFRDWVHKEKQDSGRRHDYSRQEIDKLKRTWEKEGRPKGKGGTSGRGGTRRGQRGSVSPGSFLRGNLIIFTLTTMFNIPELNASEDEIVRERMESQPEGKVTVGDVVPVRDQPVDEAPAPEKPKPEDQDENL